MKIAVLAGGYSPERDVSLSSGSKIANALIDNGHSVALVDLYLGAPDMGCLSGLFFDKAGGKRFIYQVPAEEPDLAALRARADNGDALIGPGVLEVCRMADLAFLALHGSIGENGQLQATLDTFGIRYTGTGYIGSLLAMDKDIAKKLMVAAGVPTPEWVLVGSSAGDLDAAVASVGLPCAVKPCSCGSSVGVSLVRERAELEAAVAAAKRHEPLLLIERMISGREFSVGVLGGKALPVIEIIPNQGFYDYANKYQPGFTREVCPAEIPEELRARMQADALRVHAALRLGFYARIDFMVDGAGNHHCLEANTLPGMTPTSLLPQEAQAAGISYGELCEMLARAALGQGE